MNDFEHDRFEAELRATPPARLTEQFMARLRTAKPSTEPARRERRQPADIVPGWWRAWRWLAPASAVAVLGFLLARANPKTGIGAKKTSPPASLALKSDNVQVDQELVSSFDVVAKLPGGQPVRFHCRKWNDQVVVTDTNGGVEIERDSPRLEVVPVRFETY